MATISYSPVGLASAEASSTTSDIAAPGVHANMKKATLIVVTVVSAVAFLITLAFGLRCFVVQRRRYFAKQNQQKRNLRGSPGAIIPRSGIDEDRASVAGTRCSSIWGDCEAAAAAAARPTSTFSGDDVWDSKLWPLPPGHSERYTFFSERSSTSLDDDTLVMGERCSTDGQDEDGIKKGSEYVPKAGRESSGSIWGISDAVKARN
ncbi:uncharacterized protein GGS25DRAFT_519671 [Hypoxylon fragiforme]|uniref:uncharacterized protein n=1 Tax=Hypoxylon fragiforme TaxID=63214 RepID=UPI0020C71165|nr:uncharacterized protein GGS25DRAFT_519671 [Hypoxylon fragiforme]KAI2611365.1 hypothetical protein GGS25DRAFT_519671 [Hypoxylon fragiforme]